MSTEVLVRVRVDATALKAQATAVLAEFGFTVSEAMRLLITQIARDKKLPFDIETPNAETRAAMREADEFFRARRAEREQA